MTNSRHGPLTFLSLVSLACSFFTPLAAISSHCEGNAGAVGEYLHHLDTSHNPCLQELLITLAELGFPLEFPSVGFAAAGSSQSAGEEDNRSPLISIEPSSGLASSSANDPFEKEETLISALNRLHPAPYGTLNWFTADAAVEVASRILQRGVNLRKYQSLQPLGEVLTACRGGVWADLFGDSVELMRARESTGAQAYTGGILVGADCPFTRELSLGAAVGYTTARFHWSGKKGQGYIPAFYGSVYGLYATPEYFFEGALEAGLQSYLVKRFIVIADISESTSDKYYGASYLAHLGAGHSCLWSDIFFQPFFAIDYVNVRQNSHTERKAKCLNLHVQRFSSAFLRTEFGLTLAYPEGFCLGLLLPTLTLKGVYYAPLSRNRLTAHFINYRERFTVHTWNKGFFQFAPGLSISHIMKDCVAFSAAYEGEYGSRCMKHLITLAMRWAF